MDICRYFESIHHAILEDILRRKIKDRFILELCAKIIAKGGDGAKGLPIGNLTSQFFANVYLDILDHHVKENLRVGHYLRYMDDFCFFAKEKGRLKGYTRRPGNLFEKAAGSHGEGSGNHAEHGHTWTAVSGGENLSVCDNPTASLKSTTSSFSNPICKRAQASWKEEERYNSFTPIGLLKGIL